MQFDVTGNRPAPEPDLRTAGELAPSLALPWIVRLRYGMWAGLSLLVLAAHYALRLELRVGWLAVPLAAAFGANLATGRLVRRRGPRFALGVLLVLDVVCLTAVLALSGGPANPFTMLYVVEIALSAVVLSKGWTWALGFLSVAGFASLFPFHVRVAVFEGHHGSGGFSLHLAGMWLAFAAGVLLITIFIGRVSEALRQREQEVLRLNRQLARQERMTTVAALAAGAAHELGSPLATIAVASKELERTACASGDETLAEDARLIRSEVERCSRILRKMSSEGADPAGEMPSAIRLDDLLGAVRADFPAAEAKRIELEAPPLPALLPGEAVRQAVVALVRNALEACPAPACVQLRAEIAGCICRIEVRDRGAGLGPETARRIGEPFFTTKTGRGMGLGVFLARALAENMGGRLSYDSEAGRGTTATLELPGASS